MIELSYSFTFLRHGESVGNAEERFQGQSDYPLTDKGRRQAHALAERWLKDGVQFDLAVTSPLVRTRETAQIIVECVLKIPLEEDPDLG
jgi:broad specificity phosphatase PhoE